MWHICDKMQNDKKVYISAVTQLSPNLLTVSQTGHNLLPLRAKIMRIGGQLWLKLCFLQCISNAT